MKEFEKHDKKYCDRETSHNCLNIDIYCEHCAKLREIGWRAALECLQNQIDFGVTVTYSDTDVLMAIKKYIKEELEI